MFVEFSSLDFTYHKVLQELLLLEIFSRVDFHRHRLKCGILHFGNEIFHNSSQSVSASGLKIKVNVLIIINPYNNEI